jgi:hypothetical protein
MPDAHLRAWRRSVGPLHGFTDAIPAALSLQTRTRLTPHPCECPHGNPRGHVIQWSACALSGMKNLVADAPRSGKADDPAHRADTYAAFARGSLRAKHRPCSARNRCRTRQLCRPLHPALRDSDGRKQSRPAQKRLRPRGRETSSGQSAIAHESPLAGKTPAAIAVSTASFHSLR